jgi:hypothetical protein
MENKKNKKSDPQIGDIFKFEEDDEYENIEKMLKKPQVGDENYTDIESADDLDSIEEDY